MLVLVMTPLTVVESLLVAVIVRDRIRWMREFVDERDEWSPDRRIRLDQEHANRCEGHSRFAGIVRSLDRELRETVPAKFVTFSAPDTAQQEDAGGMLLVYEALCY